MCGRTSLFAPRPAIEERFDATVGFDYRPRYNVAPGDDLAVVHDADPAKVTTDEWGFVPPWAESFDDGPRPINARAETLDENALFRSAFETRRALVVVDGFYEWRGPRGGKQPHRIARADGAPFAMAGLWSRWERGAEARTTVTIVTTDANALLSPIHDRMPVILDPGEDRRWLAAETTDAVRDLLASRPTPELETTAISTLVNDPSNDSPAVVDPIGGDSGQTGLGDFGG